jgi:hypothetical protein
MIRRLSRILTVVASMSLASSMVLAADEEKQDSFSELEFRYIGPVGNRVPAVTGVPLAKPVISAALSVM